MNKKVLYKNTNPWQYFALALGLSWFFWFWIIVFHWNIWKIPGIIFGALGLFGPAIAELILISRSDDRQLWKDYLQRLFDIRRIGWKWLLIIIITFPLINGLSLLLCYLTDGHIPEFSTAEHLIAHPLNIIPYLIFILLFGPLPEELGWRGYALDALQSRYNAFWSSIILGIIWALWHIPLFFMPGTFQHDKLGFATWDFWNFVLGTVIISILFTWIYNNTNRSTLSAILFHFMINLSGELIPVQGKARTYATILTLLLSAIVVFVFGPKNLKLKTNEPQSNSPSR